MDESFPGLVERAIGTLLREVLDGARLDLAFFLNRNDEGLLRALDHLSAADASALPPSGAASVAAHVDHLRYHLSLLNRWSRGEQPFEDADWAASWRRTHVTDAEWAELRAGLRAEAAAWQGGIGALVHVGETELTGVIASVAHLAYHLGAIRQIDRSLRGPAAEK